MKDRKFWEGHKERALGSIQKFSNKIDALTRILGILSTNRREIYRNRVEEHRMRSRLGYYLRKKRYWQGRVAYYDERVKALESRTRYARIIKSPVI